MPAVGSEGPEGDGQHSFASVRIDGEPARAMHNQTTFRRRYPGGIRKRAIISFDNGLRYGDKV